MLADCPSIPEGIQARERPSQNKDNTVIPEGKYSRLHKVVLWLPLARIHEKHLRAQLDEEPYASFMLLTLLASLAELKPVCFLGCWEFNNNPRPMMPREEWHLGPWGGF